MKTCRLADSSGRVCRRPEQHKAHGPHARNCTVAEELHHAFVAPGRKYSKFNGDPFVRRSVHLRMSDVRYMTEMYGRGGVALRIRELIAEDRGIRGSGLRQHIGEMASERMANARRARLGGCERVDVVLNADNAVLDTSLILGTERTDDPLVQAWLDAKEESK